MSQGTPIAVVVGTERKFLVPGNGKCEWFKDLDWAPELVVIPAGEFLMGALDGEVVSNEEFTQTPHHKVKIPRPFAVGRFAVTFDEWGAAAADGAVSQKPEVSNRHHWWCHGRHPVVDVSWNDAQSYCGWLSQLTGHHYRLLSEAEWEYVCRAGTTTKYWWGDQISLSDARYLPAAMQPARLLSAAQTEELLHTLPVNSFLANPWGLYQVHGNVWEWVEDSLHYSYEGAPVDGAPWLGGHEGFRMMRGGSLGYPEDCLWSSSRYGEQSDIGFLHNGFRVARELRL